MRINIQRYPLTYILIAASSVVYLFSAFFSHSFVDMDVQILVEMGALFGPFTVLKSEWWRLLSAMFLHGGMTHLLMNMFSLYIVGRGAETYFDTRSYFSIYFFSGIIGGLTSLYMHPVSVGVGASGAIFGVFGALAGFFMAHRERIASHSKAFMKDFGVIILINLLIGLSIPAIDVSAHVGGLVIGFIGGYVISKDSKWLLAYNTSMILLIVAIGSYLSDLYAQVLL